MSTLPRGTCPVCRRDVALRKGGLVREHLVLGATCPGSGVDTSGEDPHPVDTSSIEPAVDGKTPAPAVDTSAIAPALDTSVDEPVDTLPRPRLAVDTSRRRDTYTDALERATGKDKHGGAPGTLEVAERWAWNVGPGMCAGRLRSVYMRVTTPGEYDRARWRQKPGKTAWVPAGVVCDSCDAFWPKPRA